MYKKGDRVRIVADFSTYNVGRVGTVVDIIHCATFPYLIMFDKTEQSRAYCKEELELDKNQVVTELLKELDV